MYEGILSSRYVYINVSCTFESTFESTFVLSYEINKVRTLKYTYVYTLHTVRVSCNNLLRMKILSSKILEIIMYSTCTTHFKVVTVLYHTDFFLSHHVPGIKVELPMLAFFAFMLSAASGVRDRRESRFLARSALPSRRARNLKKRHRRVVRMP